MYRNAAIVIILVALCGAAWSATLMTDPAAMAGFQGSKIYQATEGGRVLEVRVEYAVYAPGNYPGNDPSNGTGYVYAYQIFNDIEAQSSGVSSFTVEIPEFGDPARPTVIGYDANYMDAGGTGVVPTLFAVTSDSAAWTFLLDTIDATEHSKVLFFASPVGPDWGTGSVQDGGMSDFEMVPTPVPEPGVVAVLLAGLGMALRRRG